MRFKFKNPTSYGEMARDLALLFEALHVACEEDESNGDPIGQIDSLNIYIGFKDKDKNSRLFKDIYFIDENIMEEAKEKLKTHNKSKNKKPNHLTIVK